MTLNEFFSLVPKAAVAFSGGTDSAFLLWAAKKYGCDVRAYYVKTPFQPQFELEDARRLASELAVPMTVVEADILGTIRKLREREGMSILMITHDRRLADAFCSRRVEIGGGHG